MRIRKLAARIALMTAFAGSASAQTPPLPPRPAVITNPTWASIPDAETMIAAHPGFASMAGLGGSATLRCTAQPEGGLTDCTVLEASPRGLGFDRAALSVAPGFRVNPRSIDGADTSATVQFRIHFTLAEEEIGPPWTGPEPDAEHLRNARIAVGRFEADVEAEFEAALQDLGVDADREATVKALMRQVQVEFTEKHQEAGALSLARLVTPAQLSLMMSGVAFPPRPPEDLMARAGDRDDALSREEAEQLRTRYCAHFECPAPRTPRPGFVRVAPPQ